MIEKQKTLQLLTCLLILLQLAGCGAVKVEPVEEGESLKYHARVGYFLHPPERKSDKYIKNLSKYSDYSELKRCEPSSITRLYERFEKRYVEIKQKEKLFLFDHIYGQPIQLKDGQYHLIDKYFRKEFPLPTEIVRRMGQPAKKSDLICQGKVWVGMSKGEFLLARKPPENIKKMRRNKDKIEIWQYETKNHVLKEYTFVNDVLEKHNDL